MRIASLVFLGGLLFSFYSCHQPEAGVNATATAAVAPHTERYRPYFHFSPEKNWMNDPNGLVYYDGEYHLFYQYNPFGNQWGHMSWGHAVSPDLVHWDHLPVALVEEDGIMIFSGSAVVDEGNKSGLCPDPGKDCMVAVYTSHIEDSIQHQSLAYSSDAGRTWEKYRGNPVLDLAKKDFRDPKVFWHPQSDRWIMVVALPREYKVQFYASGNLVDWQFLSEFGGEGNTEKIWECPDLFPIEITTPEGSLTKWVLIVSAGGPQPGYAGVQYFVGTFDGQTFQPDQEFIAPKWVDYGKDFYAAVTYNHIPNHRILMGWANNWAYAADIPTNGWRGSMAVPRELSLQPDPEGSFMLRQQPVSNLAGLRQESHRFRDVEINNRQITLDSLSGLSLEMHLQFKPLDAEEFGLRLFHGKHQTAIFYRTQDEQLIFDRTRSGDVAFNTAFPGADTVSVKLEDGFLNLKVLIDQSIIEVFVQNGKYTLVNRVFPEPDTKLAWYALEGSIMIPKAQVWKLRSPWH